MRKELVEYLTALAVAYPQQSGIVEAGFFAPTGFTWGNPASALVKMFLELGALWYEPPENVTEYWLAEALWIGLSKLLHKAP